MGRALRSKPYNKLRKQLTEARLAKGLTQVELAQLLDRPQSFVSKYETGGRFLDVMDFIDVCRAVGVSASSLVAELE